MRRPKHTIFVLTAALLVLAATLNCFTTNRSTAQPLLGCQPPTVTGLKGRASNWERAGPYLQQCTAPTSIKHLRTRRCHSHANTHYLCAHCCPVGACRHSTLPCVFQQEYSPAVAELPTTNGDWAQGEGIQLGAGLPLVAEVHKTNFIKTLTHLVLLCACQTTLSLHFFFEPFFSCKR
jgi:hypothetical protein